MLLDSNILIHVANHPAPKIEAMLESGQCSVCSVIKIEVYGFKGLGSEEASALDAIFGQLAVHELDDAVTERAIRLRQLRKIGLADAIIAATALERRLPLVTRNEEDFKKIPGLKLINPFESD